MTAFRPRLLWPLLATVVAVLALEHGGILRGVDDALSARRMGAAPRAASGDIAFLGIDKRAIDRVGVWPWPRSVHADVVQRLDELGAAEIYLDVELSAPSDPDEDAELARALASSSALVVLPTMLQDADAAAHGTQLQRNLPLAAFREHAWVATVNVRPDRDGLLRRFPYGQMLDGEPVPSIPALLSGVLGPAGQEFAVDFSIDPRTVPTLSVADLLDRRLAAEAVEGRSVVIGAHAAELGDNFSVPVHGTVPGAVTLILAAETLLQDRVLRPLAAVPIAILFAAMLATLAIVRWPPGIGLAAFGLILASVSIEAGALLAQARFALVVPTAAVHVVVLAFLLRLVGRELKRRGWLLRAADRARAFSQGVLAQVFEDSSDAVIVVDEEGRVVRMSRQAVRLFAPEGPAPLEAMLPREMVADIRARIADARAGRTSDRAPRLVTLGRGDAARSLEVHTVPSVLPDPSRRARAENATRCVVCITARDITERLRHEAALDRLSRFDELTGAARRGEFLARLDAAAASGSTPLALFALKLRRFKSVNATLGRQAGDAVLRAVVRRLEDCDPRLATVARLGSDEFAVHSAGPLSIEDAAAVAERLSATLCAPYRLDAVTARIGVHVGIAILDAGDGADAALESAETALDEARSSGSDAIRTFDVVTSERQETARRIERALGPALERGEFFLLYQPQVRLCDSSLIGVEALVRWRHPDWGVVSPGDFIPIAEASGFVSDLGRWVLGQACREAVEWPGGLTVAVNVSPVQFQRNDVLRDLRQALAASGLPAKRLQVEITESLFLEGSTETRELLHDLRMTGVTIALDDFGSGFSSFGYLANFPMDKIKADQMFVRQLAAGDRNCAILRSMKLLADQMGMKLLCEGVETEEQVAVLRSIGCDEAQGYLFGKPQAAGEIAALAAGGGGLTGTG